MTCCFLIPGENLNTRFEKNIMRTDTHKQFTKRGCCKWHAHSLRSQSFEMIITRGNYNVIAIWGWEHEIKILCSPTVFLNTLHKISGTNKHTRWAMGKHMLKHTRIFSKSLPLIMNESTRSSNAVETLYTLCRNRNTLYTRNLMAKKKQCFFQAVQRVNFYRILFIDRESQFVG